MFKLARNSYQEEILRFFFTNPKRKHHLRALARMLDLDPGNLSRQLKSLKQQGVLRLEELGGLKIYSLNQEFFLFPEYKQIVNKTIGVEGSLRKLVLSSPDIKYALIYGSAATGEMGPESDIDLILVGNVNEDKLIPKINRLERRLMREVNFTIYDLKEFKEKRRKKDSFVEHILSRRHILLKGRFDEADSKRFSKNSHRLPKIK